MNNNSNNQTTTFSHQNYGENFYVPPTLQQNKYDLNSNSTQINQIDSDAVRAQQGDQAGMASHSMPQQKQKKIYEVYYHQPGEEFAAPSQSSAQYTEGYVPTFPKREGTENATISAQSSGEYVPIFPKNEGRYPFQSAQGEKSVPYSCQNCGKCSECKRLREQEWKKQDDACMCCMKWTMLIAFGICIGMAGGGDMDCSGNDCCDEPKREDPRNQNPFRL